ncbi:MAG TPA: MarR family transcriptional regulator [Solirubrobacteraceae bacterium]
MPDVFDSALSIRAALNRKALADARHRAALARRLGLTETEVLAVQHLARTGGLTPGQLATQLQLSSGGTTGVVHRLQRAGHITRGAHPLDRRSTVLRLTPTIEEPASEAWAPLVAELDTLAQQLPGDARDVVARFLESVANAAEQHADRLARDADAHAQSALAVPLPALWA